MVSTALMRIVYPCWKPSVEGENCSRIGDVSSQVDGLLWYKDLGRHVCGEFSMAAIQANYLMEDQSQLESGPMSSVESGPQGTFVGIYDGHGGPEASEFVNDRLFNYLKEITSENLEMRADNITEAFLATDKEFLSRVRRNWLVLPEIASVGSCSLVGVVCNGQLYVANAGDSRAVLGKFEKTSKAVKAIQLSMEHNASDKSVREDLQSQHPDDPQIVVLKQNCWRVKGLIQVARSIGDAYLKDAEFNKEPLLPKFRLAKPFSKPIFRADPTIQERRLHPDDQFIIFASDGLWEHLSNQEAVDIVSTSPRNGIARRLVREALQEAAKKREMRYADLTKIEKGVRRHFHDDITVIVLFLDSHLISRSTWHGPKTSIKAACRDPLDAQT